MRCAAGARFQRAVQFSRSGRNAVSDRENDFRNDAVPSPVAGSVCERVHCNLNLTARLPLNGQSAAARAYLGREVFLGIRPECISDRAGPHRVEGDVEASEPTGAETIVLARVGGERLRARVAPDARLALGQPASFAVDTRTACLFDPATGQLIA